MKTKSLFLVILLFAVLINFALGCSSSDVENEPGGPDGGNPSASYDNPFQTGPVKATMLYPVGIDGRSDADKLLLTTLQGIVAKYSTTQIFQYSTQDPAYYVNEEDSRHLLTTASLKLKYYLAWERQPGLPVYPTPAHTTWDIVDHFKQYIKGFVVYKPQTNLQNMAVTMCGIADLIPVTPDAVLTAQAHGLTQKDDYTVGSAHEYESFIKANLENLNQRFAVILSPTISNGPQDYAAMLRGMVFWNGSYDDHFDFPSMSITEAVLNLKLEGAVPIFDYGASEVPGVRDVSLAGDFVTEATFMHNLSLLSSLGTKPLPAKTPGPCQYQCGHKYVTFIVSDGDNVQILANQLNNKTYYGSDHRGWFPIGWTMSPALYYLAPDIWNFYIQNAMDNDEFVLGPSTIGYVMEEAVNSWNPDDWPKQIEYMDNFMESAQLSTALVFIHNYGDLANAFMNDIVNRPYMQGLFFHEVGDDDSWTGWYFQGDKPINSFSYWLTTETKYKGPIYDQADRLAVWINHVTPDEQLEIPFDNGFYRIYAVRNFSDQPGFEVNDLVGALSRLYWQLDPGKVSVVMPSQFVDLQKQYREKVPTTDCCTVRVSPPGVILIPGETVRITVENIPAGLTVDWFTGGCGETLIASGQTELVVHPQTTTHYYGRVRNLTSTCSSWTCWNIQISVL